MERRGFLGWLATTVVLPLVAVRGHKAKLRWEKGPWMTTIRKCGYGNLEEHTSTMKMVVGIEERVWRTTARTNRIGKLLMGVSQLNARAYCYAKAGTLRLGNVSYRRGRHDVAMYDVRVHLIERWPSHGWCVCGSDGTCLGFDLYEKVEFEEVFAHLIPIVEDRAKPTIANLQRKFTVKYLKDRNGRRAAKAAGYNVRKG